MIITCKALLDSLLGQGIYHSISYKGASGGRGYNTWLLGCCLSKWEEFFLASDSNRRRATVLMFSFLQNCRPTNSMAFIPPIISLVGGLEHDFFILQMLGIIILTILTILTLIYFSEVYHGIPPVYHQFCRGPGRQAPLLRGLIWDDEFDGPLLPPWCEEEREIGEAEADVVHEIWLE